MPGSGASKSLHLGAADVLWVIEAFGDSSEGRLPITFGKAVVAVERYKKYRRSKCVVCMAGRGIQSDDAFKKLDKTVE